MLLQFGEEIWTAGGPTVSVAGFRYPTRMVAIRLRDGALFIWSPTAPTSELRDSIDHLGPVRHLVAPNTLHHMFVGQWQKAYPAAETWAVSELRAKQPSLRVDHDLQDVPPPRWASEVDQVIIGGNLITTEVVFFHRQSRTAIFTDLIQHFDRGWFNGWRAIIARLDLLTATQPTVPRKFRIAFSDRKVAREAVERVLGWPIDKLLTAHGIPIAQGGRDVVAHAFKWLLRR